MQHGGIEPYNIYVLIPPTAHRKFNLFSDVSFFVCHLVQGGNSNNRVKLKDHKL